MQKIIRGMVLFLLLAILVLGTGWGGGASLLASENETKGQTCFKDLNEANPNYVYINYLAQREIISGFPDGGFHPDQGLSRAQAAVIMARTMKLDITGQNVSGMKDADQNHWATGYIGAAVKAGYIKGYPDGTFKPDDKLSRAEGISLVFGLSRETDPGVELPSLQDVDSNHWAARSIAMALDAGMIDAKTNQQFMPNAPMSREELARALAILLTKDPTLSKQNLLAELKVVKNEVSIQRVGSEKPQPISNQAMVSAGETIITGQEGEAYLNFPDGSGLLIKPNTKLSIKETQGRSYIKGNGSPGTAVDWLLLGLERGEIFGAL
ncbi:MAG: S-layer homology domain-containing protein, partial [Syntrophomonas sp.]